MSRSDLCRVALPIPLRKFFTYALPETCPQLTSGTRVLVSFGSRSLIGYVVDNEGEDVGKIKTISTILDEEPFFNNELFSFLKQLSDYYLAPLGVILKNAYPSGLDPQLKKRYMLASDVDYNKNDALLAKLVEELKEGSKSYTTLKSRFGKETDIIISKSLSSGIIESLEYIEMTRRRIASDRIAVLKDFKEIETDGEETGLTKYHLKIIEALKNSSEPFPKAIDIAKISKSPHHYIQDLESLGFIELFDMLPKRLPVKKSSIILNKDQKDACEKIALALNKKEHKTFLIFGITGSGKTEIYLNLIEKVIERGGRAIYLVPEISLASYLSKRLLERFGSNVSILHSSLTEKERVRQYLRMKKG
ncbi:MAG: DEAD/DEAH box helicase family protein, partial [Acidobacteria bacterium]|nr:DEAD/DEAH box helicase family protein [Acidobacteriota bacterium]